MVPKEYITQEFMCKTFIRHGQKLLGNRVELELSIFWSSTFLQLCNTFIRLGQKLLGTRAELELGIFWSSTL